MGCCLYSGPRERDERASFEVFTKQLRCNWNLTLHKGVCFFILLLSFQLSFFLWTTLSLFLLFLSAFIFASLSAHIGFSVIENAFSALHFFLFKQGTPWPVPSQVPSAKVSRRMSAFPRSGRSDHAKIKKTKGRKRPRLCENSSTVSPQESTSNTPLTRC